MEAPTARNTVTRLCFSLSKDTTSLRRRLSFQWGVKESSAANDYDGVQACRELVV